MSPVHHQASGIVKAHSEATFTMVPPASATEQLDASLRWPSPMRMGLGLNK